MSWFREKAIIMIFSLREREFQAWITTTNQQGGCRRVSSEVKIHPERPDLLAGSLV